MTLEQIFLEIDNDFYQPDNSPLYFSRCYDGKTLRSLDVKMSERGFVRTKDLQIFVSVCELDCRKIRFIENQQSENLEGMTFFLELPKMKK